MMHSKNKQPVHTLILLGVIFLIALQQEVKAECVHVPYGKPYETTNAKKVENVHFITVCDVKPESWKRSNKNFDANSRTNPRTQAYFTYTSRLHNICTKEGDVFEATMGSYVFEPQIMVVDYNNQIAKVGYNHEEIDNTGRKVFWSRLAFKCPLFAGGIPHLVLTQTQRTQGPYVFLRRLWKKQDLPQGRTLPPCECRLSGDRPFNPGPNCRGVLGQSDPCPGCTDRIYNCQ